ncbi:hypothetical protein PFFCH_02029 [Plasmodium falciparum FCH/4]|uniref:Uncharacterized protein n=1 Tax=Plasmodium falciparum FCH/4 TaxID=1036724 RepID=A0A024VQF5_PLAFA|nr:hypothetical protein PFFCH_02029 [Plasmodium falciparum FCH/4]
MEFLTNHSRINRKNMFLFTIKMMAIFLFALSLFNQNSQNSSNHQTIESLAKSDYKYN